MQRILKWHVPVDGKAHHVGGGRVVDVNFLWGPESVQVWTLEDVNNPLPSTRALVVGTGSEFPEERWQWVGTVPSADSGLVWHVLREVQG